MSFVKFSEWASDKKPQLCNLRPRFRRCNFAKGNLLGIPVMAPESRRSLQYLARSASEYPVCAILHQSLKVGLIHSARTILSIDIYDMIHMAHLFMLEVFTGI